MGRPKGSKNRKSKRAGSLADSEPTAVRISTSVIDYPAGRCPFTLEGTESSFISDWARNIINWGRSQGQNFSAVALKYWVRHSYEIGSKEYNRVLESLDELFHIDKTVQVCEHPYGGYYNLAADNFYCHVCHKGLGVEYFKEHLKDRKGVECV